MVEIVNVVGSGSLGVELDLAQITTDIGSRAEYDPDKYPGMYLRFEEDAPLITLYRTGKYITTGAGSEEETYIIRERFLKLLEYMNIIERADDKWFQIQNIVCTSELDHSLNLNTLAIGLGLERTEYEPEQFPGLIYRSPDTPCVALLFTTGRVVITGSSDLETVKATFEDISEKVQALLNTN